MFKSTEKTEKVSNHARYIELRNLNQEPESKAMNKIQQPNWAKLNICKKMQI